MVAFDRKVLRQTMTTKILTVTDVATLASSNRFAAENRAITPPSPGQTDVKLATWIKETLLVAGEIQAATGLLETLGIMVYDVFVPNQRGTERVEALSKLIAEAFPPASSLQSSPAGQCVVLFKTERPGGRVDPQNDAWYFVPVRVNWRVFTTNP